MKSHFSTAWIASKKPNKQRKYRFNAPLHIQGHFMHAHLSKELRQKYGTRAIRLRVNDTVKIMRGQFKNVSGKVEEIDMKNIKVFVAKAELLKRDGTKKRYPVDPSNVLITELNTEDKQRMAKLSKTPSEKPAKAPAAKTASVAKKKAVKAETKKTN